MECPKCKIEMEEIMIEEIIIDRCAQCKGIWLDYGELEALIRGGVVKRVEPEGILPNKEADKITGKCPRCRVILWRRKVYDRDFHVEVCPSCFGVWLDEGELRLIDADKLLPIIQKLISEPE